MSGRLPPTKVYGAVPPPQQLARGEATESFSSIKSEPESRLAADQVQISVSNTPGPLLPVSIPGSVKQGSIMVSGIQPVSFCMEGYSEQKTVYVCAGSQMRTETQYCKGKTQARWQYCLLAG